MSVKQHSRSQKKGGPICSSRGVFSVAGGVSSCFGIVSRRLALGRIEDDRILPKRFPDGHVWNPIFGVLDTHTIPSGESDRWKVREHSLVDT